MSRQKTAIRAEALREVAEVMEQRRQEQEAADPLPLVNRWRRIELPGGLHCLARVEPAGIEEPGAGDHLVARALLALPWSDSEGARLHEEYQFHGRLCLMQGTLNGTWGYGWNWRGAAPHGAPEGYISRAIDQRGATWREALAKAQDYALKEAGRLRAALLARERALASDGQEFAVAARLSEGVGGAPQVIPYAPDWGAITKEEESDGI